jgi:isopenicillin-N N-acyltransferase like protein
MDIVLRVGSMNKLSEFAQVIHVQGSHYQMGLQHGRQVTNLLPAIHIAIDARYEQVAKDGADDAFEAIIQEAITLLNDADPQIIAFIRGLAEGLDIPFDRLLHYNLVTFFLDIFAARNVSSQQNTSDEPEEGCSTWAASGAATADGQPILVKTRDTSIAHLPLQLVVRAEPEQGYRYTYITSAGSPGVYVAGINEAGLAVVDTHVSSTDIGSGLPTYALSMHVLEDHQTVQSALSYLQSAPRQGRNNLLLVDASGAIALFEIGNRHFSVIEPDADYFVNTNHFLDAQMKPFFAGTYSGTTRGNSFMRYDFVTEQLVAAHGHIDVAFAEKLMGTHRNDSSSICCHPMEDTTSSTISAAIFLPVQRTLHFCHGSPCSGQYTDFTY